MNRKKNQSIKSLLKGMIWWHPILLILILSLLGIFAGGVFDSKETDQASVISSVLAESLSGESSAAQMSPEGREAAAESRREGEVLTRELLQGEEAASGESVSEPISEFESLPEESMALLAVGEIKENGNYTSKEEVALYIYTFGRLPSNYITKNQAIEQGWNPDRGNLGDILPGMSIGGSTFGNYEGKLPRAEGRKYFECDIDYNSGYRNAKRIVYSNDGLIFYTEDHYDTFEQLY